MRILFSIGSPLLLLLSFLLWSGSRSAIHEILAACIAMIAAILAAAAAILDHLIALRREATKQTALLETLAKPARETETERKVIPGLNG